MPNNDLISRNALLSGFDVRKVTEYDESGCGVNYKAVPVKAIEAAPSVDAVEVVRCKDCKFSKPLETIPSYRYCIALNDAINFGDDFYCARGKKMED